MVDPFLLALQQAAISCLHLIQPSSNASASPRPSTSLDISPEWQEFAQESFALAELPSLHTAGQVEQSLMQSEDLDGSSSSDYSEVTQWLDSHPVESLHALGDVDRWLDSLPPIEDFNATNHSEEFDPISSAFSWSSSETHHPIQSHSTVRNNTCNSAATAEPTAEPS